MVYNLRCVIAKFGVLLRLAEGLDDVSQGNHYAKRLCAQEKQYCNVIPFIA